MMNPKKLFKPDIMFNDHIKSCWSDNIKVNEEKKIMVHKELMQSGIYALNIEPLKNKEWFAFCLPVNKNWSNEDFTKWNKPVLMFELISCDRFKLNVQIMSDDNQVLSKEILEVNEIEDWNKLEVQIIKKSNVKLISFSGPNSVTNILMKNIVIMDR